MNEDQAEYRNAIEHVNDSAPANSSLFGKFEI